MDRNIDKFIGNTQTDGPAGWLTVTGKWNGKLAGLQVVSSELFELRRQDFYWQEEKTKK